MTLRRATVVALLALLASCVGEPLILIEARGNEFRFRTSGTSQAPTLSRINVNPVDAKWRAVDPVVCLLGHRIGSGGRPVESWTYGTELPTLEIRRCGPLAPQSWYRIGVGGGGGGTALFTTDPRGRITVRDRP